MRSSRLWLFGLALSTATIVVAGEPVSIRVNPSVSIAPSMLSSKTICLVYVVTVAHLSAHLDEVARACCCATRKRI